MNAYSTVEYRSLPELDGYRFGSDGSVWTCWGREPITCQRGLRSIKTDSWKQMKLIVNGQGYLEKTLRRSSGGQKTFRIHILIATAFFGPKPGGMECCHNDGCKTNNTVSNLRWDTHASNIAETKGKPHTFANGFPNAKITLEDAGKIRERRLNGESHRSIAKDYPISYRQVGEIVNGLSWKQPCTETLK